VEKTTPFWDNFSALMSARYYEFVHARKGRKDDQIFEFRKQREYEIDALEEKERIVCITVYLTNSRLQLIGRMQERTEPLRLAKE
jgi:hypothetical protein